MRKLLAALIALAPGAAARAQDEEALAITHVRLISGTKGELDSATILIRGEKIAEVGKDVKVPPGARVLEGKGLVAFPGMVNVASRLGTADSFGSGGGASTPQFAAADEINPASESFPLSLRTGVTCNGIHPAGGTVGGQGAILKPVGLDKETMVLDRSAFLRITLQANSQSKDALRQALEAAKRQIEAEKKNPKPAKPADGSAKPEEKAGVVVRFLRGEVPALISVGGAAELLHFWQVMDAFGEFKTRVVFLASPEVYKAAEELGRRKSLVVLRPDLTFAPFTRDRVNPAAELLRAGAAVAFSPGADAGEAAESYLFRISELVKYGVPRDAAIRAATIVPAEMLGVDKRVGSIEPGKDADLVLFDADPLSAAARPVRVFVNGRQVWGEE